MRRSGLRGVLVGALTLIALQTLVSSKRAGRVASLLGAPAAAARWFMDPSVPAIPDLRDGDDGDDDKAAPLTYPGTAPPAPTPHTGDGVLV